MEIEQEMEQRALQLVEEEKNNVAPKTDSIVDEARQPVMQQIANSEEFKRETQKLYHKEVAVDFAEKTIKLADRELNNQYEQYALSKKKELLDLRVKYEKGLIKEQVKAQVQQQKIDIALKRYGYLTPLYDENNEAVKDKDGNVVVDMSKFTPNKPSNRFKELEFNYRNMSQTARKIIWTTIKTVVIVGLIALGGWLIYKYLIPLLQAIPSV